MCDYIAKMKLGDQWSGSCSGGEGTPSNGKLLECRVSMNHFAYLIGFSTGPASVIYERQKSVAVKGMNWTD